MSWHIRPKDDAWKRATLGNSRLQNDKLWLHCGGCTRFYTVLHDDFVAFHRLDPETPFLLVNEAMRCVWCGAKKGSCRLEPYGIDEPVLHPVVGSPAEGPQPARRILQPESEPWGYRWPKLPQVEQIRS